MYYLRDICGLCLSISNIPFIKIHEKSDEFLTYFQKLTSYLPELENIIETNSDFIVCKKCCDTINTIYDFNKKCLISAKTVSSYTDVLKENQLKTKCNLSVKIERLKDEVVCKYKNESCDNNEMVMVKTEPNTVHFNEIVTIKTEPGTYLADDNVNKRSDSGEFNVKGENIDKDVTRDFIVKTEVEETPNFGEHYLSNFINEPVSQIDINLIEENSTNDIVSLENDDSEDTPILPEKSKDKYIKVYNGYMQWCQLNKIGSYTVEDVLLSYFKSLSEKLKPTTLWTTFSMLRAMLSIQEKIDISKYKNLVLLLKKQNEHYLPKTSTEFTKDDVAKFLIKANDEEFLLIKVILIIGVAGSCRRQELCYLRFDNVTDLGNAFRIIIEDSKTKKPREIYITAGIIPGVNLVEIIRRYIKLRPLRVEHNRFFLQFRRKYCTKQPVGTNTFCTVPKIIAHFLNLPNPQNYTGHCFRKSSNALITYTPSVLVLEENKCEENLYDPLDVSDMTENQGDLSITHDLNLDEENPSTSSISPGTSSSHFNW